MIAKFCIELMESVFAQLMIALHQKRAERALGKRSFTPFLIDQYAELHVYVGQLRKRVVITAQRDTTQRQKTFLGHREHVGFHPPSLVQLDSPLAERRIGNEFGKRFVVDRQNLGDKKRRRFADLCEQVLNLS